MPKKTVAIIIDNKDRELMGAMLISMELAKHGLKVFLLPFHKMFSHIRFIYPDYLLLPNLATGVTKDWENLVESYKGGIGILPSEGGAMADYHVFSHFRHICPSSMVRERVNHYFCWGEREYDLVTQQNIFSENTVILSGQSRIDLLHESFQDIISQANSVDEKYLLVSTNFPSINIIGSKGFDDDIQIDALIERNREIYGQDSSTMKEINEEIQNQVKELIKICKAIVQHFPKLKLVFRPHPFERAETYREIFSNYDNVLVDNKGGIEVWLTHAIANIQINCSTGVDAVLAGIPAISPAWIPIDKTSFAEETQDVVNNINLRPENLDELLGLLESILSPYDKRLTMLSVDSMWDNFLKVYYTDRDATNYVRIANSIAEYLENVDDKYVYRTKLKYRREMYSDLRNFNDRLRFYLNLPYNLTLRGMGVRRKPDTKKHKQFTHIELLSMLNTLSKHHSFIDYVYYVRNIRYNEILIPTIYPLTSTFVVESNTGSIA